MQAFQGSMMSDRLRIWWEVLRTSIWPVPVAMLGLAVLLRELTLVVDEAIGDRFALSIWWLNSGSGDDARNLLSTLVSALITMASVMFSITMVVLSLAANQFGSRLVRTYMADIRTQLSLGIFVMTVVYCLLVLRTVYKDMPAAEVPHVSVTVGLLLALVCILTLLLFLHVIARSMVADDVIRRVAVELEEVIAKLPPLEVSPSDRASGQSRTSGSTDKAVILASQEEGYVQSIDYEGLAEVAARHDLTVQLHCKAGAFMCKDGWLASVQPPDALTQEVKDAIQEEIEIGARRTPTQDLEFPVRHLVDIALRALSPGINDPNTAIVVIDRLRGALSRLMGRHIPSTARWDERGVLRVIGQDTSYGGVLDEAFNQIRQVGAVQPSVVIHLLGAIERMAEHVRLPDQREALLHHLGLVAEAGLAKTEAERDRKNIEEKRAGAERKLQQILSAPAQRSASETRRTGRPLAQVDTAVRA